VPGIYAAVLALLQGQDATLGSGWLVPATFGCWFVSMVLTFVGLFPRRYKVDPSILIGEEQGMGVATFFRKSAEYKRRLLIAAALIFWLGIVAALFLMLGIGAGSTP
jgi:FtsH-binding integral membrane protein